MSWLKEVKELHRGEIEVLSVAKEKNGIAITDDRIDSKRDRGNVRCKSSRNTLLDLPNAEKG